MRADDATTEAGTQPEGQPEGPWARRMREKLEADPAHPRHLTTVGGSGFRYEP